MTDALIRYLPAVVLTAAAVLAWSGLWMIRTPRADVAEWQRVSRPATELTQAASTRHSLFAALVTRGVPLLRRSLPARLRAWLQRQIDLAGRPAGTDLDAVLRQITTWLLIAAPLALFFVMLRSPLPAVLCLLLGLLWPSIRLSAQARKRQELIDKDLPDFLDVLAVTVSAGLAFRPALATVSDRFGGPVAEEITTALHQIANGASVRSAFKSLRSRNQSASMDEFVTAYLQAEELGAPLAETLNHIAAEMRRASAQRLRQQATRVAPRITLVMTVVMVPATMVLVIGGFLVGVAPDLGVIFRGTR